MRFPNVLQRKPPKKLPNGVRRSCRKKKIKYASREIPINFQMCLFGFNHSNFQINFLTKKKLQRNCRENIQRNNRMNLLRIFRKNSQENCLRRYRRNVQRNCRRGTKGIAEKEIHLNFLRNAPSFLLKFPKALLREIPKKLPNKLPYKFEINYQKS